MNVFDCIPSDFFNCLSSTSNSRIYSDCLEQIFEQYDKEVTFRLPRSQLRDVLALFLLENHLELDDESTSLQTASIGNDAAGAVLRKFCSCGWLEEELDDATFEKYIVMTDNGIALAEFLQKLKMPSTPEFSSYILNILNRFSHPDKEQKDAPYSLTLKPTFNDAKALSSSLKKLSTSIKKIIETMLHEGTLVSLTENIIQYCDGDFIKEYSRLVKQQNIHLYRNYITKELEKLKEEQNLNALTENLMQEEPLDRNEAQAKILEMIDSAKKFLHDDYNKIMEDIKQKINTYIRIAIARERMLQNKGFDLRGNVEQSVRYLISEKNSKELQNLYNLQKYEFIDQTSISYPRKNQNILQNTETEYVELSEEERLRQKALIEEESSNPYSKEEMKKYLEFWEQHSTDKKIDNRNLPCKTKEEILSALAAISYAKENGFTVEVMNDYIESEKFMIRHWSAEKK